MKDILDHIALIVCIIGGIVYVLCQPDRGPSWLAELGRIMFACGLLAVLLGK